MKNHVSLTVNGRRVAAEIEPRLSLADFLREHLHLTATHLGCEHGVCGACTVLADGKPIRACIALAVSLDDAEIRTLEGLQGDPLMEALKDAFHEKHGLQCGFCTPGMLVSAWDLLRRRRDLDERTVRVAMSGNLCRCTGYQGIVRSIMAAAAHAGSAKGPA
ncbi:MAG TPA: (2Fe-2S)-binding protein [Stellaceae bacterium]|nr:(2Fe-2S)-binding protein [Stellaceae bacterium]